MSSSSSRSPPLSPPPQPLPQLLPHQRPPHPPSLQSRQTRSDFDLEPNPFEQSFSARPSSNLRNKLSHSPPSNDSNNDSDRHRSPSASSSRHSNRASPPRPVLPPIAAISSPADPSYPWSFPQHPLASSLRSGPLSPAMLAGPQAQNPDPSHLQFDPTSFRTGLTPRTGMTPRTCLTPALGLTPLVGAGTAPFPPSPNTAALMAFVTNNSSVPPNSSLTITPNTLNAINTALNSVPTQHHYQPSHLHNSHTQNTVQENDFNTANTPNPTSTAANGLFLLSQAHQELTKREEAQARANTNGSRAAPPTRNGNTTVNGITKRNTKRKNYEAASSPPAHPQTRGGKRPRSSHTRRRSPTEDVDPEEDEDEEDGSAAGDDAPEHSPTSARRGNKKPETEEEKRKNFLERNRQAALKCRQRKKAWLASLQAKVEYLTNENDRLTSALVSSREELSRLSALVGGSAVGPGAGPVAMTVHVGGGNRDGGVNVSMPGKPGVGVGVGAGNGRSGYGY